MGIFTRKLKRERITAIGPNRRAFLSQFAALGFPAVLVMMPASGMAQTRRRLTTNGAGRSAITRAQSSLTYAMRDKGFSRMGDIFIRVIKSTRQLSVFMTRSGQYQKLRDFHLCGDGDFSSGPRHRRAPNRMPEGYYEISPAALRNPTGMHLGLGYNWPNGIDRAHHWSWRGASTPMIDGRCHGGCHISLTDQDMDLLFTIIFLAMNGGQEKISLFIVPQPLGRLSPMPNSIDPDVETMWGDLAHIWRATNGGAEPANISIRNQRYFLRRN